MEEKVANNSSPDQNEISFTFRFTCERQKQLVNLKEDNLFVDEVVSSCEEGGKWSVDVNEDYRCLGTLISRIKRIQCRIEISLI